MSSIKFLRIYPDNSIQFQVIRSSNWSECENSISSDIYWIGSIKFQLKARFSKSNIFLTLSPLEFQRRNVIYQGSLIELTVAFFYNSIIIGKQKNFVRTISLPNASLDLGEYRAYLWTGGNQTTTLVWLTVSLHHQKHLSSGGWSKKLDDKINAPWSDTIFLCCILHLYTGWLPGSPICEEVFEKLNVNRSILKLDTTDLSELYEVAKMLELHTLAYFSLDQLRKIAEKQQDSLRNHLLKMSLSTKKEIL